MHKLYLLIILFIANNVYSQTINGIITDKDNNKISKVNISVLDYNIGSISKEDGSYNLNIPPNRSVIILYSFIGYQMEKIRIPMLKKGETYTLNISLNSSSTLLKDVIITDISNRKDNLIRIKAKHVSILPSSTGGIEAILKTLPGVSSANELSSQYSVRGGNFDENLVYVNGIEVYRPFLIRSGQQEGLSFVNTDMVGNIMFSAGGFNAKYGDKMSSVLDISYRNPIKNKSIIQLSLLGSSLYTQGISMNKKVSYLVGFRYKTNKYLFNSMDINADYNPNFYDLQTFIKYKINKKWNISFLSNISRNEYIMTPEDRDTEFGTVNEALRLRVFFEGQEIDKYETYFGALNAVYIPNNNIKLQITSSAYRTFEEENFDILGEYWLFQLDNNLGSDDFGGIAFNRGVGKYINHSRNNLNATVINISHRGSYKKELLKLEWGLRIQKEEINDKISEWSLIDSAFYNFPHPNDSIGQPISNTEQQIVLNSLLKTEINLSSYRNSAYMQISKDIKNFTINAGTRGNYWNYNEELLLSPRISIAFAPAWEKDIVFRASSGFYYQPPFYKELRTLEGKLNNNIKAQKSIHYVLGSDYLFYAWGRPFKWVSEIYYKNLKNLIPYKVDNVRIQYLTNDISNGYATGIDMKINGEFVKGVESWASLSIMQTKEDIVGDTEISTSGDTIQSGYISRPTDQRVNFSMFFQDYIPGNPNYKMHLNMVYGTGLPFGPPDSERNQDVLRMPDYRRVDIGFSAIIKSNKKNNLKWLNSFEEIWVSAEVFNLLDINNTVSYLWVSDISGRQYAVPNYLTTRQLNIKMNISF